MAGTHQQVSGDHTHLDVCPTLTATLDCRAMAAHAFLRRLCAGTPQDGDHVTKAHVPKALEHFGAMHRSRHDGQRISYLWRGEALIHSALHSRGVFMGVQRQGGQEST